MTPQGPLINGQRGHSGGAAQALLRPTVADVNPPRVHVKGAPAKRGHRVNEKEGAAFLTELADPIQGLAHPRRGLCVDEGEELGVGMLSKGLFDDFGGESLPPLLVQANHAGAITLRHLTHAPPEEAVDGDDDLVFGLNEAPKTGVHARKAGPLNRKGGLVLSLKGVAKEFHHVLHGPLVIRVQVAKDRCIHGPKDARIGRAGARTQEDAFSKSEIRVIHAQNAPKDGKTAPLIPPGFIKIVFTIEEIH